MKLLHKKIWLPGIFLLFTLVVSSCAPSQPLKVPGFTEFVKELKTQYPYVKSVECSYATPSGYDIDCRLKEAKNVEDLAELREVLKEYILSDAVVETYVEAIKYPFDRLYIAVDIINRKGGPFDSLRDSCNFYYQTGEHDDWELKVHIRS